MDSAYQRYREKLIAWAMLPEDERGDRPANPRLRYKRIRLPPATPTRPRQGSASVAWLVFAAVFAVLGALVLYQQQRWLEAQPHPIASMVGLLLTPALLAGVVAGIVAVVRTR